MKRALDWRHHRRGCENRSVCLFDSIESGPPWSTTVEELAIDDDRMTSTGNSFFFEIFFSRSYSRSNGQVHLFFWWGGGGRFGGFPEGISRGNRKSNESRTSFGFRVSFGDIRSGRDAGEVAPTTMAATCARTSCHASQRAPGREPGSLTRNEANN